jgi:RNA polymerase primary sigma factor
MIRPLNVKNKNLTPKNQYLSMYFRDISDFKVLGVEEEFQLFEDIKKGDENAKRKIIESNQRFVIAVAKKFSNGDILLDLINEGNIGLIEAIDRFDNHRGVKFITFAVHYIHREILTFLKANNLIRQSNSGKTYDVLNKIKNNFFIKNGRLPIPEEIIEIMRDEYDIDIKDEMDVYDLKISSIDDYMTDDKENNNNINNLDFNKYYFYENNCNLKHEKEENRNIINELINVLTTEEFYILKLYYGIDCWREFSLIEISDITGYSSERVRQLRDNAIEKMQKQNKRRKVV